MFVLYTPDGHKISFYVKECAETFKLAYGGTIVNTSPIKLTFKGNKWQQDSLHQEQRLRQEMDEVELF